MIKPTAALAVVAAFLGAAGCGGNGAVGDSVGDASLGTTASTTNAENRPDRPRPITVPPCPADSANCERASGVIVYVERVDPDGDGDAHFVLLSDAAITSPGISVIDVRSELRPDPLPGPGDQLAASGPVYTGSYGQRQIQADQLSVRRRDGARR